MKRLLLIEDDPNVVNFIRKGLAEEGYEVSVALDGKTGLDMATADFDLVILDIMLPDKNGLEVCRDLRTANIHTPVLFLTALGTAENIAHGLNSGADDYLVKPFKFIELSARVKALLRRTEKTTETRYGSQSDVYSIGDLTVDDRAKTVFRNGTQLNLTATEYKLLVVLIRNKGRVLSRMDLLEQVWDINFNVGTNVVDVYINYLRKKLETGNSQRLIHTIVGMGYVLKES